MTPVMPPAPARWSSAWWRLRWHAAACVYCRAYPGTTAASIHLDVMARAAALAAAPRGVVDLTADQLAALTLLDALDDDPCICPVPPDGHPGHALSIRRDCPTHGWPQ